MFGCACLTHISVAILLCEHVGCMILSIQGHPFVVLIVLVSFSGQMDGQECLSTFPSYLCYLVSNSIHAYITTLNKSFSDSPSEEHSEPPIRLRLTSKTF